MRLRERIAVLCSLALATACAEPDRSALDGRVQALEKRLDAMDQRLATLGRDVPSGEKVRDDQRSLEQRLAAVEAKATEALAAAKAAPPAAAAATGGAGQARRESAARGTMADATARREQLGQLMTEYRRRLADVKRERGANASPAEQMAARREVRDWSIARRRAILSGEAVPE
jgi:hypothetical protein